jgi:hypothetical protein
MLGHWNFSSVFVGMERVRQGTDAIVTLRIRMVPLAGPPAGRECPVAAHSRGVGGGRAGG